jgi:pyruvate, water dikinase
MNNNKEAFILWFDEITKDDIPLVGGKNANLGEMYQKLTSTASKTFKGEKIAVPYGFAVTAYAYRYFVAKSGLDAKIRKILSGLNTHDIKQLESKGPASAPSHPVLDFSPKRWKRRLQKPMP